jgi:TRAP-type C4-dicarboxylate transport system permease large subunit
MVAYSIGGIKIRDAFGTTVLLFIPMLLALRFVILYPDAILWLPRHLMPGIVK